MEMQSTSRFFFSQLASSANLPPMKVRVTVLPKPSVLDPQGVATAEAMRHLGWSHSGRVRVGKVIEIDLPEGRPDEEKLHAICRDLLSNPVIEDYVFEISE
jgi:phosphoribosylformylglycinamidine synthase subunit PurS